MPNRYGRPLVDDFLARTTRLDRPHSLAIRAGVLDTAHPLVHLGAHPEEPRILGLERVGFLWAISKQPKLLAG